jgi:hypothetical protein
LHFLLLFLGALKFSRKMTYDEEYERAECIRKHGEAFWAECEAEAKIANAEIKLAWENHQAEARLAENKAKIAALEARIDALERLAEGKAKIAALQARFDALEAKMQGQEEVHANDALPTSLPTRQDPADQSGEEEEQGGNPTEIVPRPVPTSTTSVPTLPGTKTASADPLPLPADSAQLPARAIASPIVIPSPPPPFYVKAIPDMLVQDSFLFKYGVLAKWHAIKEEADTSSQPPPSLSESNEEIHVIEFGGERAKEEAKGSTFTDDSSTSTEDSTRRAFAKSLRRGCPMGTREDEWVEEFGIHSGRFKLLASPLF